MGEGGGLDLMCDGGWVCMSWGPWGCCCRQYCPIGAGEGSVLPSSNWTRGEEEEAVSQGRHSRPGPPSHIRITYFSRTAWTSIPEEFHLQVGASGSERGARRGRWKREGGPATALPGTAGMTPTRLGCWDREQALWAHMGLCWWTVARGSAGTEGGWECQPACSWPFWCWPWQTPTAGFEGFLDQTGRRSRHS